MRLAALCLAVALALPAAASAADSNRYDGVWEGGYSCAQGKTFMRLTLDGEWGGRVKGTFFFSSASWNGGENRSVPDGEFEVEGTMAEDGTVILKGGRWINQPSGYMTVDLTARTYTDGEGTWIGGQVLSEGCTTFEGKRQ
jgi:hypothetical protein